jgi:long-chain acyl-CoA synthetase
MVPCCSQAGDVRTSIGSGLVQLGIPSKASVGIYAINCREWVLVDAALHAYNMVSVPLYDTLGADAVEYICNHAELSSVACSAQVLPILMQAIGRCPSVKTLIVWGLTDGRIPEAPAGTNIRIVSLDQVESLGRRHPRAHIPPRPQDVCTIAYTSGTTGVPKGAVLSHNNLIASAAAIAAVVTNWQPGDRHICYLPLAHIYERINLTTGTHLGTAVGFYSGNVAELLDDVLVLKPHIFVSVPRLWNRVYDRVMATIRSGSPITRMLFERAYAYKKECLLRGDPKGGRWGAFYDAIIFSKIKAKVGGEVKLMTTGASPISDEVMMFLRICFGATVLEGYGMTESSSVICTTRMDESMTGHVGAPVPSCEVKLVDIVEMNYTNADKPFPRGEICVRGPGVFMGYYKDEVQTREVLDDDGWLHTGDVGMWIDGGRLKIIDRKKNIFKMAQGEYIAPEKIENVYMRSPLVAQCYVYGDSLKAQLVSVVVPDPEVLLPWAKERNMSQDLGRLMADPAVNAALLKSMLEEGREAKLKGFEQISALHCIADQFTVENGLLTPTFKIKRNAVQARYQPELDAMYARLPSGMA